MLVRRDVLREMAKLISKDAWLAALRHLKVEADGAVVACDGHRLLKVEATPGIAAEDYPTVDGVDASAAVETLIPAAMAKAVPAYAKPTLPILAYAVVDGQARKIGTTDLECPQVQSYPVCEGSYPNYLDKMPQGEPIAKLSVDAGLLAELLRVMVKLHRRPDSPYVCIETFEDKLKVSTEDQVALLMKVRP